MNRPEEISSISMSIGGAPMRVRIDAYSVIIECFSKRSVRDLL
jgi:hypothetical protein